LKGLVLRRSLLLALGALGAALPLLAAQLPARHPAALQPHPNVQTITGSQTGPVFEVVNTATASPLDVFGVAGAVTGGPESIGVVGYGDNPSSGNIGVVGLDLGPGGVGTVGYSKYSGSAAPTSATQTIGVYGISLYGSGVVGQTQSPGLSGGQLAGVAGVDETTNNGSNDGVYGATTNGAYGVEGNAGSGGLGGVYGSAAGGTGVIGTSVGGVGIAASNNSGTSPAMSATAGGASDALDVSAGGGYGIKVTAASSNDAIYATSSAAEGVTGFSSATSAAGVFGQSLQPNDSSCTPECTGSSGVAGSTDAYLNGNHTALVGGVTGSGFVALLGVPANGNGYSFVGTGTDGDAVTVINSLGDIVTNGFISSEGTILSVSPTSHGYFARSYATQAMSRILEDESTAAIANGAGIVHLDPAFVEAVGSSAYQVFLTPDADCNGLYVSQKTATSFVVRELRGGRSTIAFDYRIVAHPYGHRVERMAIASSMAALQPPALSGLPHGHASLDTLLAHAAAERSANAAIAARQGVLQKKSVKRASTVQRRFSLPPLDLSALAPR
jgi:hypothetical protein